MWLPQFAATCKYRLEAGFQFILYLYDRYYHEFFVQLPSDDFYHICMIQHIYRVQG